MGWKAFKEHYKIEHIVQVAGNVLWVGSPYIQDLMVVNLDGQIVKCYDTGKKDFRRYDSEISADSNLAKSLIEKPDTFGDLITVYTFNDGEIIEKQCEVLGWPNCTTDGQLMHENTFSTNREEVVGWAVKGLKSRIGSLTEGSDQLTKDLRRINLKIGESMAKLQELERSES
jgi:hypothetical protein